MSILKTHFFLALLIKRNKLQPEIRMSGSYDIFQKSVWNFIRPSAIKVYNVSVAISIKLITRLGLGFSHLREHKFKDNFRDTLNPLSSGNMEVESASHDFLRFHFFNALQATLMNNLRNIDGDFLHLEMKILQISYYTVSRYMRTK